jgi:hypothetical protein
MSQELIQPEFVNLIFEIRGRKVMIDSIKPTAEIK